MCTLKLEEHCSRRMGGWLHWRNVELWGSLQGPLEVSGCEPGARSVGFLQAHSAVSSTGCRAGGGLHLLGLRSLQASTKKGRVRTSERLIQFKLNKEGRGDTEGQRKEQGNGIASMEGWSRWGGSIVVSAGVLEKVSCKDIREWDHAKVKGLAREQVAAVQRRTGSPEERKPRGRKWVLNSPGTMTGAVLERAAVSQELNLQGMTGRDWEGLGSSCNRKEHLCAGTAAVAPVGLLASTLTSATICSRHSCPSDLSKITT